MRKISALATTSLIAMTLGACGAVDPGITTSQPAAPPPGHFHITLFGVEYACPALDYITIKAL